MTFAKGIFCFYRQETWLADAKLIEANGLEVDEFDLTGEIMPVDKKVDGEDVFVYRGSRVTRGNGRGIVTATGEETEYGEIFKQRWGLAKYQFPSLVKKKYFILPALLFPPFVVSLSFYSSLFLTCLVFLAVAVFVILIQNNDLFKYVLISSEMKKIKSKKIQFHDETALESMSSVDIICFDKTGVLTTRDIEVKRIQFADESPDMNSFASDNVIFGLTKIACALCNDIIFFERLNQADPIDRALISFALKNQVDINELAVKYKRIYEKPFDSEDRYMACGYEVNGKRIYFAKGDPEVILRMCKEYVTVTGIQEKITLNFRSSIVSKTNSIDQKGDRTIALAYSYSTLEPPPSHYTFLCMLQLENPVEPGAHRVIKTMKEKGIRTLIVTGDRPETAMKVSKEVGLDDKSNYFLTGKIMERMDISEVARQSDYISVFARLLPSQKGILITSLQRRNKSVVMVGDGANDTIALKVADVGISFAENSSPFAKRVSKILINNLADLLTIIQSAGQTKKRIKYLTLSRAMVLVSMSLILYSQMLSLLFIHFL